MSVNKSLNSTETTSGSEDEIAPESGIDENAEKCSEMETSFSLDSCSSDEDEDDEDIRVDKINETVSRNKLTKDNVKDIIKNVVSNDQVLAICKLRAEEIERHIENEKKSFTDNLFYDSPDGTKLTRKKAKELNHTITTNIPVLHLNAIQPNAEVAQLVNKDLNEEDDDDDNYEPNGDEEEDDDLSDEGSNATCSDIESQPRTPAEALNLNPLVIDLDEHSPNKSDPGIEYDEEEGVFKKPGEPRTPSKPDLDETISRRTRSKLCLTTTAIETIQKDFVPPDCFPATSEDANEGYEESDQPWQEFLEQFQKPLDSIENADEEEDDLDPEYVARGRVNQAGDKGIVVTKREVQVLLDNLLESFEDSFNPDFVNDLEFETLKVSLAEQVAEAEKNSQVASVVVEEQPMEGGHSQANLVEGQELRTPLKIFANDPQIAPRGNESVVTSDPPQIIEPLAILDATPTFSSDVNMVLASDNKLYLVPKSVVTGDVEQEGKGDEDVVEEAVDDGEGTLIAGWNKKRLRQLHYQLVAHIQLLGQYFVQCYSHPEYWREAKHFMTLLADLEGRVKKNADSILKTLGWNLEDMMGLCRSWQADLNVESEENLKYVKALVKQEAHFNRLDGQPIHDRVMERLVSHRAFVFGELLPRYPVGALSHVKTKITNAEKLLYTFCIDEATRARNSKRTTYEMCAELFRRKWNPYRQISDLFNFHKFAKLKRDDNPVAAYYLKKVLPKVSPPEMNIASYDAILPHCDKPKNTLNRMWNRYIFSKQRLLRVYHANEIKPDPNSVKMKRALALQKKVAKIESLKKLVNEIRVKEARKDPFLTSLRQRKVLTVKLHQIQVEFHREYDKRMESLKPESFFMKIFHFLREFDIFIRLLAPRHKEVQAALRRSPSPRRKPKRGLCMMNLDGSGARVAPEPIQFPKSEAMTTQARDSMFAWAFIERVHRYYSRKKRPERLEKFLRILRKFEGKPEAFSDLFCKLEDFFLPNDPSLVELLLRNFLPEYANHIGRFIHRVINQDVMGFLAKLSIYMRRREKQWRRIMNLLIELDKASETGSNVDIRGRFLNIFEGNTLLIDWFRELFERERSSVDKRLINEEGSLKMLPVVLTLLYTTTKEAAEKKLESESSEEEEEEEEVNVKRKATEKPLKRPQIRETSALIGTDKATEMETTEGEESLSEEESTDAVSTEGEELGEEDNVDSFNSAESDEERENHVMTVGHESPEHFPEANQPFECSLEEADFRVQAPVKGHQGEEEEDEDEEATQFSPENQFLEQEVDAKADLDQHNDEDPESEEELIVRPRKRLKMEFVSEESTSRGALDTDEGSNSILIANSDTEMFEGLVKEEFFMKMESPDKSAKNTWSRAEDQLILGSFHELHTFSADVVIERLGMSIPNRTEEEIRERFKFLLRIINR